MLVFLKITCILIFFCKYFIRLSFIFIFLCLGISFVNAESLDKSSEAYRDYLLSKTIILKSKNHEFTIKMIDFEDWVNSYPKYFLENQPVKIPDFYIINDKYHNKIAKTFEIKKIYGLDRGKIKQYLESEIAPHLFIEKKEVIISKNKENIIQFEGFGKIGESLDYKKTISLIKYALEHDTSQVLRIPIKYEQDIVKTKNKELLKLGIKEIVAVGESNFARSSRSRIHNIKNGSNKISGSLILPNKTYSIGENLGRVDGSTGYRQELVIKGTKTIPEYGGGLCQVSSTLYRAALRAGLPITERRNHSYAVSYYTPWGTDATIYPPTVDLKFKNNTNKALLIQSFMEGTKLYFNLYGTRDGRTTELYGPYISNWRSAPVAKIEYTSDLPPGQKKMYGNAHSGFDVMWYRYVNSSTGAEIINESIFSRYQARPLYYAIGAEAVSPEPSSDL